MIKECGVSLLFVVLTLQIPKEEILWPCHPHSSKISIKPKISLGETENGIFDEGATGVERETEKHTGRKVISEEVDA